jgi:hypothetical protein
MSLTNLISSCEAGELQDVLESLVVDDRLASFSKKVNVARIYPHVFQPTTLTVPLLDWM